MFDTYSLKQASEKEIKAVEQGPALYDCALPVYITIIANYIHRKK